METAPKIVGTSLEVLAPYLPYGIDVELLKPRTYRARLVGLGQPRGWNSLYLDGHDPALPLADCLPVLYPFHALPAVLAETPWGLTPASVVLARMITGMQVMPENVRPFGNSLSAQDYPSGPFKTFVHADTVEAANLTYKVVEWLRANHFAVGLNASQFIEKAAAAPTKEGSPQPG